MSILVEGEGAGVTSNLVALAPALAPLTAYVTGAVADLGDPAHAHHFRVSGNK